MTTLTQRVLEFDVWRAGYAEAVVIVYKAGTVTPATLWSNVEATVPADNPQTLMARLIGDTWYGKFTSPVYTNDPYYLHINSTDETGVSRLGLISLTGEDGTDAVVTPTGGSVARTLGALLSEQVFARSYGALGTVPVTNTATLTAAIGAASTRGGGVVHIPSGTYPVNGFSVPTNVILAGDALGATILTCAATGSAITIAGDDAGLQDLTVDGISLIALSTGVYAHARRRLVLDNVEIKRFATGLHCVGGRDHIYRRFRATNCTKNVRLLGDMDVANGGTGDEFSGLDWLSGSVGTSATIGLEMTMNDAPVRHNSIAQVDFADNAATAVDLRGASWTVFRQCYWFNNVTHIKTADGLDATQSDYEIVSLHLDGGQIIGGKLDFSGLCQDFWIASAEISTCQLAMTLPGSAVLLRDCVEDTNTITGETSLLTRWRTADRGVVIGQTGNATPQPVWRYKLGPGDIVHLDLRVTAEQSNGADYAVFHISHGARCAQATLTYDNVSVAFTAGRTVLGLTSGATAVIASIPTGTTALVGDVHGTFVDNELLDEQAGTGAAQVNGTLAFGTVSVLGSAVTTYTDASGGAGTWAVAAAGVAQELVVSVTGQAAKNINWTVCADVTGR